MTARLIRAAKRTIGRFKLGGILNTEDQQAKSIMAIALLNFCMLKKNE